MKSATITFSLALLCFMWGSLQTAYACSCVPPPPPNQALEQAASVFSGTVVRIDTVELMLDNFTFEHHAVTVNINQSWKGLNSHTVTIYTATNSAACGYYFEPGQEYLIYTYAWTDVGVESTGICSRTRRLIDAVDDFNALGSGRVVSSENKPLPDRVSLYANYPNPFNPTTRITYRLATTQTVTLTVYDLLGRPVQTLAQGNRRAGIHQIDFDATNLPSGTYIYTLDTGAHTLRRMMTLSK